ncbi:MAG: urea transporter [Bacteroidia bacterium]|nr:urea transporter [Bacteroidia bacterium]
MKEDLRSLKNSIVSSYSQVFFSDNHWFGFLILLATFVDPHIGFSGLISIIFSLILLKSSGYNPATIKCGYYTYNVLLTGLAMGAYFQFSITYIIILLIATLLTLLLTIWLSSITSRYKLPFLSLPFVLAIWILLLNAKTLNINILKPDTEYTTGYWSYLGSLSEVLSGKLKSSLILRLIFIYFKSLGSIFFQTNIIAGLLIAGGLLLYSRIAFFLSLTGFICGYIFFTLTHANMSTDAYTYSGINYIFSAIALGGFFLIPSASSYLLVILSTPVIGFILIASARLVEPNSLPLYSLPFSLGVIMFISALNNRYTFKNFHQVQYQLYTPEKNLYAYHMYMERFKKDTYIQLHLPFYGEWFVSQGHEGKLTHKGEWRFALDFVVCDEHQKTFRYPGEKITDFYCYSLPVTAPADGLVVKILDGIDDNEPGEVNLTENWGNTIVIKHLDGLYSKLSHIKKDSFKVKEYDYVKKGDMLALCGNSGRSPEPHIHFQLQTIADIGAHTLKYPLSYYITKRANNYQLHSFDYPEEGETILRPVPSPLIQKAFHFIPGMKFIFDVTNNNNKYTVNWEVFTDSLNQSYLYCHLTGSTAYFTNNDTLFYFTTFKGDKNSLLYFFYLAAYKVLLSYYPDLIVHDQLNVDGYYNGFIKLVQDTIAPFYIFLKPAYTSVFTEADNRHNPKVIMLVSKTWSAGMPGREVNFVIELSDNKIRRIIVKENQSCITAENIS